MNFLPKTNVIGFRVMNNFRVQSFRVATQKWEEKLISEVYTTFSNAFKFQFLSFKQSFK